eukprot:768084-Hanusia_phi.AAC.5
MKSKSRGQDRTKKETHDWKERRGGEDDDCGKLVRAVRLIVRRKGLLDKPSEEEIEDGDDYRETAGNRSMEEMLYEGAKSLLKRWIELADAEADRERSGQLKGKFVVLHILESWMTRNLEEAKRKAEKYLHASQEVLSASRRGSL